MNTQIQENKRLKDILEHKLKEKQKNYEKLETEISSLKKKLEEGTNSLRMKNSNKIFNGIINNQTSTNNKT